MSTDPQVLDKVRSLSLADRLALWRAGLGRRETRFHNTPEPRSIGQPGRARHMLKGQLQLGDARVDAQGRDLWDIPPPTRGFRDAAHGFTWLDDLAAACTVEARDKARVLTHGWILRHAKGSGPGWDPGLTGQRLLRWINHAQMLLAGVDEPHRRAFMSALRRQTRYLARRWQMAPPGLARFHALAGLICGGLSLENEDEPVTAALHALEQECQNGIDADGGIPGRNPEELLDLLVLLDWVIAALRDSARLVPGQIQATVTRMVPTLRALRHADGTLARFHGGGPGIAGRLDHALNLTGVRPRAVIGHPMGYARLAAGRTSLLMDAAPPPGGDHALTAHASTLAIEVTSGRRPLIISCGSGVPFGPEWALAGRATASHSTACIEGHSSSRLGQGHALTDRAQVIVPNLRAPSRRAEILLGHTGWAASHGLVHMRNLELSPDGRILSGQDAMAALDSTQQARLGALLSGSHSHGIPWTLRFHLHPDVEAHHDTRADEIRLGLRSGEIWVFRHDGSARLALLPSHCLEADRLNPRPTCQIVLSALVIGSANEVGWTLAKAQDTPLAIRDLERDDDQPV